MENLFEKIYLGEKIEGITYAKNGVTLNDVKGKNEFDVHKSMTKEYPRKRFQYSDSGNGPIKPEGIGRRDYNVKYAKKMKESKILYSDIIDLANEALENLNNKGFVISCAEKIYEICMKNSEDKILSDIKSIFETYGLLDNITRFEAEKILIDINKLAGNGYELKESISPALKESIKSYNKKQLRENFEDEHNPEYIYFCKKCGAPTYDGKICDDCNYSLEYENDYDYDND